MLRSVDQTIGPLVQGGFTYELADHAWTALDAYTCGFTLQKLSFPLEPARCASAARQFLTLIPVEQVPWLNGMSQEVIAGRQERRGSAARPMPQVRTPADAIAARPQLSTGRTPSV